MEWIDFNRRDLQSAADKCARMLGQLPAPESSPRPPTRPPPSNQAVHEAFARWARAVDEGGLTLSSTLL